MKPVSFLYYILSLYQNTNDSDEENKRDHEVVRLPYVTPEQAVWITPEIAGLLLDRNERNRRRDPLHDALYGRAMAAKAFGVQESFLCFVNIDGDPLGELINGQHRLAACVKSNSGFPAFILSYPSYEAIFNIDQGRSRTVAQGAILGGIKDGFNITPTVRLLHTIKNGIPIGTINTKISTLDVIDAVTINPELLVAVRRVYKHRKNLCIEPSIAAVIYYIGTYILDKPDEAADFLRTIAFGQAKDPNNPQEDAAYMLWDYMMRSRKQASGRVVVRRNVVLRKAVKAWNIYANDWPVKGLKLGDTERVSFYGLDLKDLVLVKSKIAR